MKRAMVFSVLICCILAVKAQSDKSWMTLPDMEANQLRAQLLYKKQLYDPNIDVRHARLELDIDPNSDSISGCSRLTIEWLAAPFDRFFLDFTRADMHVDSVIDAEGNKLDFIHNARDLIDIQRGALAEKGLLEEVSVYFSGKPERPGRRSFTYQLHGRPGDVHRVAATLSQPYGARDWWPCRDNLYDKIDSIDMVVAVPPGMLAAGLGSLEKVSKGTERDTFHWKHRYPVVSYLVAVGVTNYSEYTDWYVNRNGDSLAVLNYVFPVIDSLARTQTPIILEMMRVFEDLFGPYPFYDEKYGHAQFVFSGGMEHQTMSFMGNFDFDLQAHELAHQWFGNMVTCGSWQDIWLNEGFATYLTMLCHEHIRGDSAFMAGMNAMRTRVMREPDGSVYIPAEDTLNVPRVFNGRLSYEKGAWVLHMLRFVLGDEDFYAGLNTYLYDNANQHAFVSTKKLQDHLEAASGKDLNLFFNEWVYGQGFPEFVVRWRADNNQLDISLTQNTSIPAWNYFSIPVPVLVQGIERDTLLLLEHQGEQERFNFSLPFRPQSIVVDPFVQVLARFDAIREQSDEEKYRLAVFPIPAQHELSISSDSQIVRRTNIYDISGKLLQTQTFEPSGSTRLSIDMQELKSGVYFIELITDNGQRVVRKVVKE